MHPMTAGRVVVVVALAAGALTGCGGNAGTRTPSLGSLPLTSGSRVVARARQCNAGANAYCAIELVVVDPSYRNSWALVAGERRSLAGHGWTADHANNGDEHAATSPGDKLRVTYATAYGDLKDIELGWITRSHTISLALSRQLFARSPTMSLMLEAGS
jgi:hypothetical protein